MAERTLKAAIALFVLAAVVSILAGILVFLQTRDPVASSLLVVALPVLLATFAVLAWVARDAPAAGLPKLPWMVAILLAPGLGLVGYLLARELVSREPEPGG